MARDRRSTKGRFLEVTSVGAIEHMLRFRPERIQQLIFSVSESNLSTRMRNVLEHARRENVAISERSSGKNRKAELVTALIAPFQPVDLESLIEKEASKTRTMVLVLDHLQDPQNFGALCRTAEALGISGVVLPKDRSVPITAGVYNASVGTVETLTVCRVVNLGQALRSLKESGFWLVGASLGEGGAAPWEMPDFEKVALVMGAEYEGLSARIADLCDWKAQIPLVGHAGSLNVSAAGAILMYEWFRTLKLKGLE